MSTFNGLICEIEGVSVDSFENHNLKSRTFFLSHCHADHMRGMETIDFLSYLQKNGYIIYTSDISSIILTNRYKALKDSVASLSIGAVHSITIPKGGSAEEDTIIDVTLLPAGHCPGSVMFLFHTPDKKTILYTGDFRLYGHDFSQMKHLREKFIDKLYLDTTFWNDNFTYFPNREDSCKAICHIIDNWLSGHECNEVNLLIRTNIGTEYLYKDIYNKLKIPICVKYRYENLILSYRQIAELEEVLTINPKSRIFTSGNQRKGERTCNIKVSALRWRNLGDKAFVKKINFNEYEVCYSSHCSFQELKDFVTYIKPKSIEPCVVPKQPDDVLWLRKSLNEYCDDLPESRQDVLISIQQQKHTPTFFSSEEEDEEYDIPKKSPRPCT